MVENEKEIVGGAINVFKTKKENHVVFSGMHVYNSAAFC